MKPGNSAYNDDVADRGPDPWIHAQQGTMTEHRPGPR